MSSYQLVGPDELTGEFEKNWSEALKDKYKQIPVEDCINMDYTFACFILPRLEYLKNSKNSHPAFMQKCEWKNILDKMIQAFDILVNDNDFEEEENPIVNEGLQLFAKHFRCLWD